MFLGKAPVLISALSARVQGYRWANAGWVLYVEMRKNKVGRIHEKNKLRPKCRCFTFVHRPASDFSEPILEWGRSGELLRNATEKPFIIKCCRCAFRFSVCSLGCAERCQTILLCTLHN